MASTAWIPMTRMEKKSWLLGNGEIVTEPPLEMTPTGRKVRVAGTKESVYQAGIDDLLAEAARKIAEHKQTNVWLDVTTPPKVVIERRLSFLPSSTKAELHLIHAPGEQSGRTICWWRFKDPNSPFEAIIHATLYNGGSSYRPDPTVKHLQVELYMASRNYYGPQVDAYATDSSFSSIISMIANQDNDLYYKWTEFVRDNQPETSVSRLGTNRTLSNPRLAVSEMLKVVREIEEIDKIQVPNLGDLDNPSWLNLELYETNVNAEILSDLTEYLDGAPTVEKAAAIYRDLLETLRSIGIPIQAKNDNDFLAALLAGDKSSLSIEVQALAGADGWASDQDHKLSLHLPTGTFIVECSSREVDHNQVAEKWEEAKTLASLTGEEDELLAYARKYAESHNSNRTKQILKTRRQV